MSRPPVAKNLDAELVRTGMTNDEAARRIVTSERHIRRWRKGEFTPSWENLVKLAVLFDRDPAWFYVDHEKAAA